MSSNLTVLGNWQTATLTTNYMFSLICVWIIGWVNNREAGDLRRHPTHYDVIVMRFFFFFKFCLLKIEIHLQWPDDDIQNGRGDIMKSLGTCSIDDSSVNTLRPTQNGRHFLDDIFKCIFLNENVKISIKISLQFVPKGQINNIPTLVQIMAWRCQGSTKPLSESTRTTRTPAFWGYPPPPHDYLYYWPVHFKSQVHTIDQFISDPKSKQGESRKISEKLKF